MKVEPADRETLDDLVTEANGVVAARDAADWESLASVLKSLSEEIAGIDGEPIRVAAEDITAFLESAKLVADVAAEGAAYIAKIDMFGDFRKARTSGIELRRKGQLEEALDIQERFLLSCRRARENDEQPTLRDILTAYLDAQPLLEEDIQKSRDELRTVLSAEREALPRGAAATTTRLSTV